MGRAISGFVYQPGQSVHVMASPVGCWSKKYLQARTIEFLSANKVPVSSSTEDADVLVFNTCAFDNLSERESLDMIERNRVAYPDKQIIVMGCLSKINPEALKKHKVVLVGPKDMERFDALFNAKASIRHIKPVDTIDMDAFEMRHTRLDRYGPVYPIQIAQGCANECSYCAIRKANGYVTSRPVKDIIDQIKKAMLSRYRLFFFIAQDCASYGLDIGSDLSDLLDQIVKIKSKDFFIALEYCEPSQLIALQDKVLSRQTVSKIVYLKISLQSASNKVLKLMNRKYRVNDVIRLVKQLREINPLIFISSEVMFGFPGEERADLRRALKLADLFDEVEFFLFTPKKNTPAAGLKEKISVVEKKARTAMVMKESLRNPKVSLKYSSMSNMVRSIQ